MKTRKLVRMALGMAVSLLILGALSFSSRSGAQKTPTAPTLGMDWQAKVDATVLSKAALGPTDFYIHMSQQADLSGAYALSTKEEKGQFVYQQMTMMANATQPAVRQALTVSGAEFKSFWVANGIWARGTLAAIQAVAVLPEVAYVYPSGSGSLVLPPQVPGGAESVTAPSLVLADANPEPGLLKVNADDVWAMGILGDGAVVAGADTGVRWTHSALKNQYRGWNGATADHNYNWHDAIHNPNTVCPGSGVEPCDDDAVLGGGHGSHTVGTMVGDDGGSNRIGMAPEAKWIACRNMNNGLGVIPTYMECMEWFIAPTNSANANPDTSKAPDVINNSWGCVEGCPPPALQMTLQASRAAGIFYAVSAGNDGVGEPGAPGCSTIYHPLARYPEAFTVGATYHTNDAIAEFSSRGPVLGDPTAPTGLRKPNISAPGVTIRSALRATDASYGNLSGTSMAGPHVAGLVALLISANPNLAGEVDVLEDIIEQKADDKTTNEGCGGDSATQVPNNTFGWGRINALASVLEALPPTANDDTANTPQNTPVTINVLANDSDPDGDTLTVSVETPPANGSATVNPDKTITYTPDTGFTGEDTFTYKICGDEGCDISSDTATVTVTVAGGGNGSTNYALSSNGGTSSASSSHISGGYPASSAIDGNRIGNNWGNNGGWNDGTRALWPDTLEVTFNSPKFLTEIRVYTLQNNWWSAGEPTETTLATSEGILNFEVQRFDGTQWLTVPSGVVTGNDKAMRIFTLPPMTATHKIRVVVTAARTNWTRIVEVEAFGAAGQ